MKGLNYLKFVLRLRNLMCKLALKNAYFPVPLGKDSRKSIRWEGNFKNYCVWARPSSLDIYKLLKIPMPILRTLNIRIKIYLDDSSGNTDRQGHGNFLAAASWVCHQFQSLY